MDVGSATRSLHIEVPIHQCILGNIAYIFVNRKRDIVLS